MAYSILSGAGADGSTDTNGYTTQAYNTTGADVIWLGVGKENNAETISDSKSNTYTLAKEFQQFSHYARLFYCLNPTVGSGHTFTIGGTAGGTSPAVAVMFGTGSTSTPVDQTNGATGGFSSTVQPGSITPGFDNEILVTVVECAGPGMVATINGGFTVAAQIDQVNGAHHGVAMAYLIQTTATAANPTWSGGDGDYIPCIIASFKAGAAATAKPGALVNGGLVNSGLVNRVGLVD